MLDGFQGPVVQAGPAPGLGASQRRGRGGVNVHRPQCAARGWTTSVTPGVSSAGRGSLAGPGLAAAEVLSGDMIGGSERSANCRNDQGQSVAPVAVRKTRKWQAEHVALRLLLTEPGELIVGGGIPRYRIAMPVHDLPLTMLAAEDRRDTQRIGLWRRGTHRGGSVLDPDYVAQVSADTGSDDLVLE